jgi:hypothetical protein
VSLPARFPKKIAGTKQMKTPRIRTIQSSGTMMKVESAGDVAKIASDGMEHLSFQEQSIDRQGPGSGGGAGGDFRNYIPTGRKLQPKERFAGKVCFSFRRSWNYAK